MPRWPAYVMGAFALACAYPAITASAPMAGKEGVAQAKPAMAPMGLAESAAAIAAKG